MVESIATKSFGAIMHYFPIATKYVVAISGVMFMFCYAKSFGAINPRFPYFNERLNCVYYISLCIASF
ncbi:Uncharacterized protein APZ42_017753 [Daphnia magna]|uniref:Uncharacterized protein n=1 Tax=Daphnia magna TaxID=35525 RepID=A0A162CJE2_9CRUS|nr:Uncharacterized protein APZ42_017753 [Daphnia magna]